MLTLLAIILALVGVPAAYAICTWQWFGVQLTSI